MVYKNGLEEKIEDYLSDVKYPRECSLRRLSDISACLLGKETNELLKTNFVSDFIHVGLERIVEGEEDNELLEARTLVHRLNARFNLEKARAREPFKISDEEKRTIENSFQVALDSNIRESTQGVRSLVYLELGGYHEDLFEETGCLISALMAFNAYSESKKLSEGKFLSDSLCAQARLTDKVLRSQPFDTYWYEHSKEVYQNLRKLISPENNKGLYLRVLFNEGTLNYDLFRDTKRINLEFLRTAVERVKELLLLPYIKNDEKYFVFSAKVLTDAFYIEKDLEAGDKAVELWELLSYNKGGRLNTRRLLNAAEILTEQFYKHSNNTAGERAVKLWLDLSDVKEISKINLKLNYKNAKNMLERIDRNQCQDYFGLKQRLNSLGDRIYLPKQTVMQPIYPHNM